MAKKKWHIKCCICDKEESFDDTHDISHAKWSIIAWVVQTGEPYCTCNKCDYITPKR